MPELFELAEKQRRAVLLSREGMAVRRSGRKVKVVRVIIPSFIIVKDASLGK